MTIADGDGNVTTVERVVAGNPTAIVAPFGQRTAPTLNADGYLASIANPAGETVQAGYAAGGLMTSFTDARNGVYRFAYDAQGRLIRDEDPAGGVKTLARVRWEVPTLSPSRSTPSRRARLPTP